VDLGALSPILIPVLLQGGQPTDKEGFMTGGPVRLQEGYYPLYSLSRNDERLLAFSLRLIHRKCEVLWLLRLAYLWQHQMHVWLFSSVHRISKFKRQLYIRARVGTNVLVFVFFREKFLRKLRDKKSQLKNNQLKFFCFKFTGKK
jgi:hypothetical protein